MGTLRVVFQLPYRQLEGLARKLGEFLSFPSSDYTTLCLRLSSLNLDPALFWKGKKGEGVVIAVDSTGVKVTSRGEWMRERRKGWVKIHVAVDVKRKQVLSLEVSDERTHDKEKLKPLVKGAKKKAKVLKVLGDGGYSNMRTLSFWHRNG